VQVIDPRGSSVRTYASSDEHDTRTVIDTEGETVDPADRGS
jgi:hypothetical protein